MRGVSPCSDSNRDLKFSRRALYPLSYRGCGSLPQLRTLLRGNATRPGDPGDSSPGRYTPARGATLRFRLLTDAEGTRCLNRKRSSERARRPRGSVAESAGKSGASERPPPAGSGTIGCCQKGCADQGRGRPVRGGAEGGSHSRAAQVAVNGRLLDFGTGIQVGECASGPGSQISRCFYWQAD